MSDPRNVAHDKKVTQEKKHEGKGSGPEDAHAVQPGRKPPVAKHKNRDGSVAVLDEAAAGEIAVTSESSTGKTPPALESSLVVLTKLKELEFHSRANLERLAELALTVEDELKQKEIVSPLAEVYFRTEPLSDEAHHPDRGLQGRVRPHARRERVARTTTSPPSRRTSRSAVRSPWWPSRTTHQTAN